MICIITYANHHHILGLKIHAKVHALCHQIESTGQTGSDLITKCDPRLTQLGCCGLKTYTIC